MNKEENSIIVNKILENMKREPQRQDFTIDVLNNYIKSKDIIINNEYQRNYITKQKGASKFVESVFLGCVIPEIQLFEEKDCIYEIIDGQQRVVSLINFYNNKYRLSGLEQLKELNGLYFEDLPIELQRKYRNYVLSSRIMKNNGDRTYKYFIFERLNLEARPLNKQEIRNSIFRESALLKKLKKFSCENNKINSFFEECNIRNERYERLELILRLISIGENFPCLEPKVSQQINKFLELSYSFNENKIDNIFTNFVKTMEKVIDYFGITILEQKSTKGRRVKKAHIETIYISMLNFTEEIVKDNIEDMKKNIDNAFGQDFPAINQKSTDCSTTILDNTIIVMKAMNRAIKNKIEQTNIETPDVEKLSLWRETKRKSKKIKCGYCGEIIKNYNDCKISSITKRTDEDEIVKKILVHKNCAVRRD